MANTVVVLNGHETGFVPARSAKEAREQAVQLSEFIVAGAAGVHNLSGIDMLGTAVAATGTLTCATVVATNTFTINGVTFTGVASGATNNQFNIGGDNTATAANIASAINASTTALVSKHVIATSALAVVTLTALVPGHAGNAITITSGGATITVSGARLTGGSNDSMVEHDF